MNTSVRKVRKEDVEDLKTVLDSIELFPAEMLEDMISNYFNNPESKDIWFTATADEVPISIGYCAPEALTNGTYNLYAIGVRKDVQGKRVGSKMMAYLEHQLKQQGHRILIVETSGTDDFQRTRRFYENLNYRKEAVIQDFWSEGDDKVVYWKRLK